jgi:hypothetical protein
MVSRKVISWPTNFKSRSAIKDGAIHESAQQQATADVVMEN